MDQAPWNLVALETIPPTVDAWSITDTPALPVSLENLALVRDSRVIGSLEVGEPTVNDLSTLAYRNASITAWGPADASQYPIQIEGLALVDTSPPGSALAYFLLPSPVVLNGPSDRLELQAIILVARNNQGNG